MAAASHQVLTAARPRAWSIASETWGVVRNSMRTLRAIASATIRRPPGRPGVVRRREGGGGGAAIDLWPLTIRIEPDVVVEYFEFVNPFVGVYVGYLLTFYSANDKYEQMMLTPLLPEVA